MLGNFSFGDYFKDGAIDFAWEFVDRAAWGSTATGSGRPCSPAIPGSGSARTRRRSPAGSGSGSRASGSSALPRSENFWGRPARPARAGPCSELYYDRGEEHGCGEPDCAPGCERCERFLEFWNLVFMEFDLAADGSLTPLPKQNIDTGMGLERGAMLLQEAELDLRHRRLPADHGLDRARVGRRVRQLARGDEGAPRARRPRPRDDVPRRGGVTPVERGPRLHPPPAHPARRHAGAADRARGRPPAAGDRRRADRAVVPGGRRARRRDRARRARRGGALPRDARARAQGVRGARGRGGDRRRGRLQARRDLRLPDRADRRAREERGQAVDMDGYGERDGPPPRDLARRRRVGRAARRRVRCRRRLRERVRRLREDGRAHARSARSRTLGDGLFLAKLRESPFYAAGGGQVTDAGELEHEETGATRDAARGAPVRRRPGAALRRARGSPRATASARVVPWSVRFPTMANHTATHLLHEALREVLGEHVKQAGSAVRPDKLRFDFTHDRALTPEERGEVERLVNEQVFENLPVRIFETPIEEARKLGAMMLFGEKYGDDRARRRDRRLLARALRRHARPLDRRDRAVRDPLGGVGRLGRAADRGGDLRRGVRAAARARAARPRSCARSSSRRGSEAKEQPRAGRGPEFVVTRETAAGDVTCSSSTCTSGDPLDVSDRLKQQHAPAVVIAGRARTARRSS